MMALRYAAYTLAAIVVVSLAYAAGTMCKYALEDVAPLVACATEDSTNCVWRSDTQGNGGGQSFIDIDGIAYYFSE